RELYQKGFQVEKTHIIISLNLSGIPFTLGNATSSSMQIYDSISKANVLLSTLTNESTSNTLREFSFLIKWDSLSENEKQVLKLQFCSNINNFQEKFSKYCCHELNFYLYMKDTTFFQRVVKPYLRNKLYKVMK